MKQVKKKDLHARFLFLSPPSPEELERRLRGRGTENEDSLKKRLDQAVKEMEFSKQEGIHDRIVVNDDVDKAYAEMEDFILGGTSGATPSYGGEQGHSTTDAHTYVTESATSNDVHTLGKEEVSVGSKTTPALDVDAEFAQFNNSSVLNLEQGEPSALTQPYLPADHQDEPTPTKNIHGLGIEDDAVPTKHTRVLSSDEEPTRSSALNVDEEFAQFSKSPLVGTQDEVPTEIKDTQVQRLEEVPAQTEPTTGSEEAPIVIEESPERNFREGTTFRDTAVEGLPTEPEQIESKLTVQEEHTEGTSPIIEGEHVHHHIHEVSLDYIRQSDLSLLPYEVCIRLTAMTHRQSSPSLSEKSLNPASSTIRSLFTKSIRKRLITKKRRPCRRLLWMISRARVGS